MAAPATVLRPAEPLHATRAWRPVHPIMLMHDLLMQLLCCWGKRTCNILQLGLLV